MILPNKYISISDSLLGSGAALIRQLDRPRTVSYLWDKIRKEPIFSTFEHFTRTLTLLYILEIVGFKDGLLYRRSDDPQDKS